MRKLFRRIRNYSSRGKGGGGGGGWVGGGGRYREGVWGGVTSCTWLSMDVRAECPPFSALPGI